MNETIREAMGKKIRLYAVIGLIAYCLFGINYLILYLFQFLSNADYDMSYALETLGLYGFAVVIRVMLRVCVFIFLMCAAKTSKTKIVDEIFAFIVLNLNVCSFAARTELTELIFADSFLDGKDEVRIFLGFLICVAYILEAVSCVFFIMSIVLSITRKKQTLASHPFVPAVIGIALYALYSVANIVVSVAGIIERTGFRDNSMFKITSPLIIDCVAILFRFVVRAAVFTVLIFALKSEQDKITSEICSLAVLALNTLTYIVPNILIYKSGDMTSFMYQMVYAHYFDKLAFVYLLEGISFVLITIVLCMSIVRKKYFLSSETTVKEKNMAEYSDDVVSDESEQYKD